MLRSLRFRLPAIFLVGVLLAAVVTAAIAVRFFQDDTRARGLAELRRQAGGLAELYAFQAQRSIDESRDAPTFAPPILERATGSAIYYSGVEIFPGQVSGLRPLPESYLEWEVLDRGRVQTLELQPPGTDKTYLAAAHPIRLGGETFGAIVVAKPRAELRERWVDLAERLGLAFLAGLAIALGFVWYLTRRVTKPVLTLSHAADEVARRRYGAELPEPGVRDEIAHLTESFRGMTERLAEAEAHERHFLVRVSHELRTPVTAIRGHVDALRDGLAEDTEAREASLDVIRAETDRLTRLVGDLVDLARLEAHSFTLEEHEVELRLLVEQGYQSFAEEARRREINYDLALEEDPVVHTDGDRVLQIVSNLLANAFSWTPDGGTISVALSRENGCASVVVTDSGPGIPPAQRERVFRPFVSENGQGSGLGLAISREIAEALGGHLKLDSVVGRGSRFELQLPAP
ncbi:MAG TPA: HAMP domain-containing sensor histidine kinase [Gaiellaceae bacterium]|nr:HAMP domain-containing sensor histidine kinase [Gaiellaceae bacterium]